MNYTYTIKHVDIDTMCMDVEYSCDGKETILVGVPVPKEGDSLESVLARFAPMCIWEPDTRQPMAISENTSGELPYPIKPVPIDEATLIMHSKEQFERDVAVLLIKFGVLQSDPTIIKVTEL